MDFQLPEKNLLDEEREQILQDIGFVASDSVVPVETRIKTSLRMIYEAQKEVIKRQIGDLEGARSTLGLSQRKMAQLLMVDPSAWTRWNLSKTGAPPHIYRALQWYLTIHEKIPGLTPQYFIGRDMAVISEKFERKIEERLIRHSDEIDIRNENLLQKNHALEAKIKELELSIKHNRIGAFMLGIATLILAFALARMLIK